MAAHRLAFLGLCLAVVLSAGPATAQGRAYYWGDPIVNGDTRAFRLDLPATTQQLALIGLEGGNVNGTVGVSAGGSLIAVAGRDGGAQGVLNVYGAAGGAPLVNLHSGDGDDDYSNITFSPDSAWVAFIADLDLNGANALYAVPAAGGTVKRVSQLPLTSGNDVTHYAWASDAKTIAFRGDPVTDSNFRVWTVNVTAGIPAPVDIIPGGANPNAQSTLDFDSSDRIYFISEFEVIGTFRLYRANTDGTNLEQVPGTNLANGSGEATVVTYGISPDGLALAFASNSPDLNIHQIYTMPLSGSTPVLVSNAQTIPNASGRGPVASNLIDWSPDGSRLAVSSDWDPGDGALDNDFSVFIVPSTAPAGGTRLLASPAANSDVAEVIFGSNTEIIVLGDLVLNNDTELYVTSDLATADQSPAALVVQDVAPGGDVLGFVVFVPALMESPPAPHITSITDVPNDDGKQVSIVWQASSYDVPGRQTPIVEYAIFRQIDPALSPAAQIESQIESRFDVSAALLAGWHYVTSVPAFADAEYAAVVPTLADSTIDEGLYNTTFLVRAATATPAVSFDSAPDSGFSVDDLAPAVPSSLAFGAVRVLTWDPALETDFAYHTVYGSPTMQLQDASLIGHTVDATFDVNATPNVFYLVTTTDHSGNEGLPAVLNDPGTVSTGPTALPGVFALLSARPNPFRAATVIAFELPVETEVDIRLFDSAGRMVRQLDHQIFAPGRHTAVWDGSGDAGMRAHPGVYFVQVKAGSETRSQRVVFVR